MSSPVPAPAPPPRTATLTRTTKETSIQIALSLDGGPLDLLPPTPHFPSPEECNDGTATPTSSTTSTSSPRSPPIPPQTVETHASQTTASQQIWIWTGVGFLDHMLHAWAKHAGWSLRVRCRGDLYIDDHHTIEDTLLALGTAFTTSLGSRTGLARFGYAYAPLDEALSRAVLDISSRPFFVGEFGFQSERIGNLSTQMVGHGLGSWAQAAGVTLHVDVLKGVNDHHRCESAFKALAGACRMACARVGGREGEVVSTKGVL
ncbi:imidazoleglycerol-phosphate dehydratase [Toensbergia leucococca]|nr:imidazoleglycerol-phosphate dehydratase [Toensbergia leucococca]